LGEGDIVSFEGSGSDEHGYDVGSDDYGERPFGVRPFGARPFGVRPFGVRPFGVRPFGVRPFGVRPFGVRPFGVREGPGSGRVDPEEWGADIAELFCERSAVVRLGASLASTDDDLWVPTSTPYVAFRAPGAPPPATPPPVATTPLSPREWRLEAWASAPIGFVRNLARNPEVGDALKADLAEGLARQADSAFLEGTAPPGIAARAGLEVAGAADLLAAIRGLVSTVRTKVDPSFGSPGWVLHPETLDALTLLTTTDGLTPGGAQARTLDTLRLLTLNGADGGTLLGYGFATSPVATKGTKPRIYFGADWREAWIAVGAKPVVVDTPADPAVPDALVIRASMTLDFTLRRDNGFAWADAS
jgi:Phage capsid family